MVFKNDIEVVNFVKEHKTLSERIVKAREYTKELEALITGEDYISLLNTIDNIESKSKREARRKYTFPMDDMFERLFTHIENVWTATGGTKIYNLKKNEIEELVRVTSEVRGGYSIEKWNQTHWMPVYHTDPSGITFLEYISEEEAKETGKRKEDPFPVYKHISKIRYYTPNGINLENILFEPKEYKDEKGNTIKKYRVVDDEKDYIVIENGDNLYVSKEESFNHPFGVVPALINSDIIDPKRGYRLSPVHRIINLCKEYLRDKSILTLFKFTQGFPLFWRYYMECRSCNGSGCDSCDDTGVAGRRDITDEIMLPIPKVGEEVIAPNIADWITPPIEIWDKFEASIEMLERLAKFTHWGAIIEPKKSNTATEKIIDTQPIMQKLNRYSQPSEIRERKIVDMYANYLFPTKDKSKSVASITYGRAYAILSSKTHLDVYETAKDKGDNAVILDKEFNKYLLAEHKTDEIAFKLARMKADVDPYLHYDVDTVAKIFGHVEAQKKMLFSDFWEQAITANKTVDMLKKDFDAWFEVNKPNVVNEDLNKE